MKLFQLVMPNCMIIISTCFRLSQIGLMTDLGLFVYYDLSLLSVRHGDDVDARRE